MQLRVTLVLCWECCHQLKCVGCCKSWWVYNILLIGCNSTVIKQLKYSKHSETLPTGVSGCYQHWSLLRMLIAYRPFLLSDFTVINWPTVWNNHLDITPQECFVVQAISIRNDHRFIFSTLQTKRPSFHWVVGPDSCSMLIELTIVFFKHCYLKVGGHIVVGVNDTKFLYVFTCSISPIGCFHS